MERANSTAKDGVSRRKRNFANFNYRRRSRVNCGVQYNAELGSVLGLTLKSNCAFACDSNSALLAYPAGCVIVLHNPRNGKQQFIFNPGQKTITCLKFSCDGNFIATGESGHQPCVRVFSVSERSQVAFVQSHKYGVSCVDFSPNSKYVISIGYQHDNVINVWDWKRNIIAASNKVSTKVKSVAFSECSNYFVTVGNRHVKFWYLEKASTPDNCTVPLKGRSAILETLRNHMFCDVVCGVGADSHLTFAITRSGLLCQFNAKRTVARHVELKGTAGRTVCIINDTILCGSGNGYIYIYSTKTLDYMTEIAPPDIVQGYEVLAMSVDVYNMWLHLVFSDHSLVITDVMDFEKPNVTSVSRFHSSCVWDIKTLPECADLAVSLSDCFVSCSNDGRVRIWKIEDQTCVLKHTITLENMEKRSTDTETSIEARCISVRNDGKHMAVGDRSGSIHVYDLMTFKRISFISSHDGDILGMDYSHCGTMLASASRDRCVHMFTDDYTPSNTIADHSAAVTAVKFANRDHEFRLMSCGTDKSLYFCAVMNSSGKTDISREQHYVEKHSMADMAIVDDSVLVACGCNLSEYDIFGAKLKRTFRGNEAGSNILRVAVDNQGTLVATSCVDKNIYVLAYITGDCVCVISGHSEVAVALTFNHNSHLISASADSCIFVWTISHRVAEELKQTQKNATSMPGSPDLNKTSYFATNDEFTVEIIDDSVLPGTVDIPFSDEFDDPSTLTFHNNPDAEQQNTDESLLPKWVTKHLSNDETALLSNKPLPELGKWGDKLHKEKICEEIENLAQFGDLISIVSSCDDESFEKEKLQLDNLQNIGTNAHIADDLSTTSESLDEDNQHLNATYTKQDFQNQHHVMKKFQNDSQNSPEVGELPCGAFDDLDDDKSVSENNFAMVSRILNENAALCKKIKHGLEPVAIETEENNSHSSEVQSSFEHVDIRALIFSKSPRKTGEQMKSADVVQQSGDAYNLPHGGASELPSHDGTSELSPQDGTSELPPRDGASELSPQDGASELPPRDGASELSSQDGASELPPQDGASELPLQDGTSELSSPGGASELPPQDGAGETSTNNIETETSPLVEVSEKLPAEDVVKMPSLNGAIIDLPHDGATESNHEGASNNFPHGGATDKSPNEDAVKTSTCNPTLPDLTQKFVSKSIFTINSAQDYPRIEDHSDPDLHQTSVKLAEDVIQEAESDISEETRSMQSDKGSTTSGGIVSPRNINGIGASLMEELAESGKQLDQKQCHVVVMKTQLSSVVTPSVEVSRDVSAEETTLNGIEVDDIVSNGLQSEDDTQIKQTNDTNNLPSETCEVDVRRTENPQTPTSKQTEIPPAFAELLDSLRKKRPPKIRRCPPKTLPLQKTYNEEPPYSSGVENCRRNLEINECQSKEQQLETNNNYMDGSHADIASACDKASENLLAVFNQAQEIYHKQKEFYGNGNERAVEKLVKTFRSIHSQITDLNIVTDSNHISMDNLSDNSPVVSLLREYSDRLVDIVHTQVDGGKILSRDTV